MPPGFLFFVVFLLFLPFRGGGGDGYGFGFLWGPPHNGNGCLFGFPLKPTTNRTRKKERRTSHVGAFQKVEWDIEEYAKIIRTHGCNFTSIHGLHMVDSWHDLFTFRCMSIEREFMPTKDRGQRGPPT